MSDLRSSNSKHAVLLHVPDELYWELDDAARTLRTPRKRLIIRSVQRDMPVLRGEVERQRQSLERDLVWPLG